jgi:hypothetical protein
MASRVPAQIRRATPQPYQRIGVIGLGIVRRLSLSQLGFKSLAGRLRQIRRFDEGLVGTGLRSQINRQEQAKQDKAAGISW